MHLGKKPCSFPPLTVDGTETGSVRETKLLGVVFSDTLGWDAQVDYLCNKASARLYFLTLLKYAAPSPADIVRIFTSLIRSVLENGCEAWHPDVTQEQADALKHIQKKALRAAYPHLDYDSVLSAPGLSRLNERRENTCHSFIMAMLAPSTRLHHVIPIASRCCPLHSVHFHRKLTALK